MGPIVALLVPLKPLVKQCAQLSFHNFQTYEAYTNEFRVIFGFRN
jgi:hypothetical protein